VVELELQPVRVADGVAPYPLNRADDLAGDLIERAIRAHHRRRLGRLGLRGAIDPRADGWALTGSFAPRPGCDVEVLVDGEAALARIADAVARAESHVHVAGWHFSPSFRLGPDGPTVRELLADAAERVDVRVLCWAGAPLPFFHPDRREVRAMRDGLVRGTRISMTLDPKERPLHCHHEKLVLVDDRVAFVGGIDLTDLAGDRLDGSEHPPRNGVGWHDAAARLEGPVVADVAEHFLLRWRELSDERPAAPRLPDALAGVEAQLVRTVPERVYDGLRGGEFTILESYLRALRSAERLVYIESQFLWSPEIVLVLADKLRNPPTDEFRVVVVLPSHPNNGGDDTRGQLGVLIDADRESGDAAARFLACTLYQPGAAGRPVYVHAKIGIVDDRWLTVGSANLNEHSLFNDTEVNVVLRDAELTRALRLRLWAEHLERPESEVAGDPARIVDELWKPCAEEQLARRRAGDPSCGRLALLPRVSRRANALRGPLNGLFVDG
jgi:phosphatidylserine/phosphatidylglycerophosphate/cardiolipin synthase-like enzyme